MFGEIAEKGKLSPEHWEKLKTLRQICWSCGREYTGQKTMYLVKENAEVRCCI